jgi:hypothetical protein
MTTTHVHVHFGDKKVKDSSYSGPLGQLIRALDSDFKKSGDTSDYENCIEALNNALHKAERS